MSYKPMFEEVPKLELVTLAAKMPCTDLGLAMRFHLYYGDTVFYVKKPTGGGDFYIYDGKHWKLDAQAVRVGHLMRNVIRSITTHEAAACVEQDEAVLSAAGMLNQALDVGRQRWIEDAKRELDTAQSRAMSSRHKWGLRCENGLVHVNTAVRCLPEMLKTSGDGMDAESNLINSKNGTLNLQYAKVGHENSAGGNAPIVIDDGRAPAAINVDMQDPLAVFWDAEMLEVGLDSRDYYPMTGKEIFQAYSAFCLERGVSAKIAKPLHLVRHLNQRGYYATNTVRKIQLGDRTREVAGRRFYGLRNLVTSFDGERDEFAVRQDEITRNAAG